MTTAELNARLATFLTNNPWSTIVDGDDGPIIRTPWSDETLCIEFKRIKEENVDALNDLILYPSFSGLYHVSTKSLELVFTPFRQKDMEGRVFDFSFEERTVQCEFAAPSNDLFVLADANEPIQPPSKSDYRNLRHFRRYTMMAAKHGHEEQFKEIYSPVSFWVRNFTGTEEDLARTAEHINFYMAYFDQTTPVILVHETDKGPTPPEKRVRFLWDSFPGHIRATAIDPYLLGQWGSAHNATDSFRKFIYYYQMLEYAAFYFLSERSEKQIETVLRAPETAAFPMRAWQRIQDVLAGDKVEEPVKLVSVVRQAVDPSSVWKIIDANRASFEREMRFDGGFVLSPVISSTTDLASFQVSGLEKLVHSLRNLRNALVHAREKRMSNVIAATTENHALIKPYVSVLGTIAMQVARCDQGTCT